MAQERLSLAKIAPDLHKALNGASAALAASTADRALIDLVYLRVSQINGCAYCVDLHARDLAAAGEELQRLNSLVTWRETEFYSERERAALAWAEAVTRLGEGHAPDETYKELTMRFSDKEIAELTFAVALMNAWNRLAVSLRLPVKKAPLRTL